VRKDINVTKSKINWNIKENEATHFKYITPYSVQLMVRMFDTRLRYSESNSGEMRFNCKNYTMKFYRVIGYSNPSSKELTSGRKKSSIIKNSHYFP